MAKSGTASSSAMQVATAHLGFPAETRACVAPFQVSLHSFTV